MEKNKKIEKRYKKIKRYVKGREMK